MENYWNDQPLKKANIRIEKPKEIFAGQRPGNLKDEMLAFPYGAMLFLSYCFAVTSLCLAILGKWVLS